VRIRIIDPGRVATRPGGLPRAAKPAALAMTFGGCNLPGGLPRAAKPAALAMTFGGCNLPGGLPRKLVATVLIIIDYIHNRRS
jgi:hypothetical protein